MINKSKILLILFLLNLHLFAQDDAVDKILAVVGDEIILLSDVENQYIQYKSQGYSSSSVDLKCNIFEETLVQKLLVNQAAEDSVVVSDKQVEAELDRRLRFFVKQIGSERKLEEQFNKSILEIKASFRKDIKNQLLAQTMLSRITEDIEITPSEVREYYKNLPADSVPLINAQMQLQQITKHPEYSDKEILNVKKKLNEFRKRIHQGDDFTTLAVLYSDDPSASKNGGDLGWIGRSDVVPEFAAVAFNLDIGEVSNIVKTDFGYHIIKVLEKRGELIHAQHILLRPKISPREILNAKQYLDSVSALIRKDTLSFGEAAEKFSDDEQTRQNGGLIYNPYTGSSVFEQDEIDGMTYYAIKNLKIGEFSEPFKTVDEKGYRRPGRPGSGTVRGPVRRSDCRDARRSHVRPRRRRRRIRLRRRRSGTPDSTPRRPSWGACDYRSGADRPRGTRHRGG